MTKLLTVLALVAGFMLIFYLTGVIGQEEPLAEGFYVIGPPA